MGTTLRPVRARTALVPLALVGIVWLALGTAVAAFTSKVADWFVMTDELLYERLALSIVRTGSPLPRVHAQTISNVNQLYPLVIAPVFRGSSIVEGLHGAHVLNAFVMSSAALPAYLLARRVSGARWLPVVVAVATVTVPWITLSSFLLTEVVAYPAFAWALLAIQASTARPSPARDAVAVAGIAVAVLARTQFYALAAVLPLAIVARAVAERRIRRTVRAHALLVALYAVAALLAVGLTLSGRAVLGTYTQTTSGNPLPPAILGSIPAHLAVVALAGGLLPFLVGGAWVVSNLGRSESHERHAFAWVALVTLAVLTVEVASFNLRFGGGVVRDRYLFYVTPVLLCALAAALSAQRPPRLAVAVPLGVFLLGVSQVALPVYEKLNADTPASVVDGWLRSSLQGLTGARIGLALLAIVVALVYLESTALVGRAPVAIGISVALLVALPAETGYAFKRLFAVNGTAGLPLTLDQSTVFGWVDRQITTNSEAVMVPYPVIRDDYWANIGFWWDLEFWNASVDREAARPNEFSGTPPGSFPKLDIRFDPQTGRSTVDVDSYIAQAVGDTRFHVAGRQQTIERDVSLVFPDRPWRADWVTYGLYPDGWTRPNTTARVRVFADPAQTSAVRRTLTFTLLAPGGVRARRVTFRSDAERKDVVAGPAPVQQAVSVCVPRTGYSDVFVRAAGASPISVDQRTAETFGRPRTGGVLIATIVLAEERGGRCVVRARTAARPGG